jgi:hypothetical protein
MSLIEAPPDPASPSPVLATFEGLAVVGSSIEIPNAAGGLREALKVDPMELHLGDEFYVTFRCRVRRLRFDPVDKEELVGPVHRVHVSEAVVATVVSEDLVGPALEAQAKRIADAKEIEGQRSIDDELDDDGFDDDPVDAVEDLAATARADREAHDETMAARAANGLAPPPYVDYDTVTAKEIIARLTASTDRAHVLAVGDFEESHKNRPSVMQAAMKRSAELLDVQP